MHLFKYQVKRLFLTSAEVANSAYTRWQALIHSDYSSPGNIIIEHRTDSFKFSNPGTLLVSLEQYYKGGISECRNPSLQKMFLMMGSAEKAGSGVNKNSRGLGICPLAKCILKD